MKHFIKKSLATATLALSASGAFAADTVLTISSWAPPGQGMNAILWPEFTKMLEEASEGRMSAEVKYGLAPPPAQFDVVLDGAADITWIFHGYNPGRFVASKIIEIPGYEGNAEAASVAYWKAYEKYIAAANEHEGVKVLAMMTHGPGILHSEAKVTSLDQISGMKLRLGGGVSGDVGAALGATGIRVPAPKVYETLASKSADGVMMPMEGRAGFKLFEVAPHIFTVPGGFYRGSFAILMNQDTYDVLSDENRAALDSIAGETLSRVAGRMWDTIDDIGAATMADNKSDLFTEASAQDAAAWEALKGPIIEGVLAEVSDKGIDAKAVQAFIADEMANN